MPLHSPEGLALARAVHVLAVILWIGGVGVVTTALLPAARRAPTPQQGLDLFLRIEEGFSVQARWSVLLAGLSGFFLLDGLHDFSRILHPGSSWWLLPMIGVWTLFAVVLFILEPFVLRQRIPAIIQRDPAGVLRRVTLAHRLLLTFSLLAAALAAAGAHGGL
ncbi:MAG: hypothetical protein HQL51_04130 [Magnetococcales bacterium]|nr:hypothetical protein [Magnetococcales bacterium]